METQEQLARVQKRWSLSLPQLRKGMPSPARPASTHSLPPRRSIAQSLCRERGYDIYLKGLVPQGGTILVVEELTTEIALVLLASIDRLRIHGLKSPALPVTCSRSLSLRYAADQNEQRPSISAIVNDLVHERLVVMSLSEYREVKTERRLTAQAQSLCVEFGRDNKVEIHFSNPLTSTQHQH